MKHLMFYINAINGGGAERVMVNLAGNFAAEGVKVTLVTSFRDSWEYELSSLVTHISLEEQEIKQSRIARNVSRIYKLRQIIKQEKPDAIVSFMAEPNFRMMAATIGIPVYRIISVRNDPNKEYDKRETKLAAKILFPFADGCVFQTKDAQQWFPLKLQKKSRIIVNAVKEDFFKEERTPNYGEIVTCGRLEKQKNHELLIRAFSECYKKNQNLVLKIYGEGSLHTQLQKLIDEMNLSKHVFLMGSTKDVVEALKTADVFVLSSDYEGMPNALMEALAMGIPCISTDCPCGGPRMLLNGQNGILVSVGSDQEMAAALLKLVDDEEYKKRIGYAAKTSAAAFRNDIVFSEWKSYISSIVDKK